MKTKILLSCLPLFVLLLTGCDRSTERRKIKLSEQTVRTQKDQQLTTTIHLEPTLRRAIAVMFFENETGDQDLEWLQKGLAEMFIRALSQSQYLSVVSMDRLLEIFKRLNESGYAGKMDMAAVLAKEANVEAVLTGNISRYGDSLQINVKVHEPNQGKILKEESIEGPGLENLFSMVDQLTKKVKNTLQLTLEEEEALKGIADISTNSLEAWRHYTAGIEFMNQYLLSDATIQFQKAIDLDSAFVLPYIRVCYLLFNQGENQQAYEAFKKLQSLKDKATPQELFQIYILEARINREPRRIIEASHQWLQQYPNDLDANFELANIYFYFRDYDKSINYYKRVLEIDPKYKFAYNMLGYVHGRMGDFSNALLYLQQYHNLAPDEPNPFDSMGEVYWVQGDFKNARKHYQQALKVNENFIPSLNSLGNINLDEGKYDEALESFNQYLDKADERSEKALGYYHIGLTQWRLKNLDNAITNFQHALEYQDYPYRTFTRLMEIYREKNDQASALKLGNQTFALIEDRLPKEPTQINTLGNLSLWYDVNIDETINLIEEILKTNDNRVVQMWGRYYLALIYLKTNQWDKYKQTSQDFAHELIEILNDIRGIRFSYDTWKGFRFFNQYAYQNVSEGIEKYNQIIDYCLENQLNFPEMVFRTFLTDLYFQTGKHEQAKEQLTIAGIPAENKWLVIGPFDNRNGFQKQFPPEKRIKLDKTYKQLSRSIKWHHPDDGFQEGYINLRNIYDINWSVAYGLIYVNCPDTREVQLRIGSNESVKVWLNDEEVWKYNYMRDSIFDDDIVNVTLKPGNNKVLIKVCNKVGQWGFYFRVTDKEGRGMRDVEFGAGDENV